MCETKKLDLGSEPLIMTLQRNWMQVAWQKKATSICIKRFCKGNDGNDQKIKGKPENENKFKLGIMMTNKDLIKRRIVISECQHAESNSSTDVKIERFGINGIFSLSNYFTKHYCFSTRPDAC